MHERRLPPFPISPPRLKRLHRSWILWIILFFGLTQGLWAQSSTEKSQPPDDADRLSKLEELIESVNAENRRLAAEVSALQQSLTGRPGDLHQLQSSEEPAPVDAEWAEETLPTPQSLDAVDWTNTETNWKSTSLLSNFRVGYENGFVIVPDDLDSNPFSLKINSQNQFRYNGFSRDATSWTDSAGNVTPITNTNNFQIPRGRLIFSGKVFMPKLSYLLNIDYNSVTNNPIGFRAYALGYQFNRSVEIYVGQSKVPGTREWIESAFAPLEGPDRTMATTFFRPSLSQGIWFIGEPLEGLHYHAMMSNGFNTLNLIPGQLNNKFCWSGSVWWEPWGDFGRGYADWEHHESPVVRIGSSYTFALGKGSQSASDAVENSSIRLSDGTLITQTGAIAPGVTLLTYDISLAAVDLSYKYQGWSLSTEGFLQELSALRGDGPLPISSTRAYGGFLQGGYFVIPQTLEFYSRNSIVTGAYGTGTEVAGGLNWFLIPGKNNLRYTFDTAWLNHSPADQNRTGFVAGQTGLLFRMQITATY